MSLFLYFKGPNIHNRMQQQNKKKLHSITLTMCMDAKIKSFFQYLFVMLGKRLLQKFKKLEVHAYFCPLSTCGGFLWLSLSCDRAPQDKKVHLYSFLIGSSTNFKDIFGCDEITRVKFYGYKNLQINLWKFKCANIAIRMYGNEFEIFIFEKDIYEKQYFPF